jgi:predicted DNA-binding transcriptional regulator AlpA
MNPDPELPRFVRAPQLQAMLGGISRPTLNELVRAGVLHPPIRLSRKVLLWDVAAVTEVIEQRRRGAA